VSRAAASDGAGATITGEPGSSPLHGTVGAAGAFSMQHWAGPQSCWGGAVRGQQACAGAVAKAAHQAAGPDNRTASTRSTQPVLEIAPTILLLYCAGRSLSIRWDPVL
jgi:hypothetical protein